MNRRAMYRRFRIVATLFLALGLASCNSAPSQPQQQPPLAGARIGGPFTLIDKDGKTVHWSDFAGSYRIVYFGYTFCPDACPTDMQVLMNGFRKFEKAEPKLAAKVQPMFISVDPERDGPKQVGQFAAAFHPRLMGLTGTPDNIAKAAKEFAVWYQKGDKTAGGYLVNHTRMAYLFDPDGKPMALLPIDKSPDAVAAELGKWVH